MSRWYRQRRGRRKQSPRRTGCRASDRRRRTASGRSRGLVVAAQRPAYIQAVPAGRLPCPAEPSSHEDGARLATNWVWDRPGSRAAPGWQRTRPETPVRRCEARQDLEIAPSTWRIRLAARRHLFRRRWRDRRSISPVHRFALGDQRRSALAAQCWAIGMAPGMLPKQRGGAVIRGDRGWVALGWIAACAKQTAERLWRLNACWTLLARRRSRSRTSAPAVLSQRQQVALFGRAGAPQGTGRGPPQQLAEGEHHGLPRRSRAKISRTPCLAGMVWSGGPVARTRSGDSQAVSIWCDCRRVVGQGQHVERRQASWLCVAAVRCTARCRGRGIRPADHLRRVSEQPGGPGVQLRPGHRPNLTVRPPGRSLASRRARMRCDGGSGLGVGSPNSAGWLPRRARPGWLPPQRLRTVW
jgi:hypothetical protein